MVLYAKDIAEKDFLSLRRETTALEAARSMSREKHGFAIVVSPAGTPEGMVTEWDYLSKVTAENRDPARTLLADIMTTTLVSVDARDGIDNVAQTMAEKGIRRLLVIENGKVIGVITARTVLARLKDYVDRVSSQIARLQTPPF